MDIYGGKKATELAAKAQKSLALAIYGNSVIGKDVKDAVEEAGIPGN